jgi:signal transduction histidine kinase
VVRLETEGGLARFSVVDQGPGLTPEDRQRLFVRFARLSARPTAGEPSAGLGLSIVKHLVEAMGGRIQVESEPGRGATFTVELPLAP